MDQPNVTSKPEMCLTVGLECHHCARQRAAQVASLCGNLSATGIEAVFQKMYSDHACTPMLPTFAHAYFEATEPARPLIRLSAAAATA